MRLLAAVATVRGAASWQGAAGAGWGRPMSIYRPGVQGRPTPAHVSKTPDVRALIPPLPVGSSVMSRVNSYQC